MSLPQTSRELAKQIEILLWGPEGCGAFNVAKRIEPFIDACVRAREANAMEEAARTFESEYCDHDSPMIGTIRGLKAIRALAKDRRQLEPERMQPAGEANERQGGE